MLLQPLWYIGMLIMMVMTMMAAMLLLTSLILRNMTVTPWNLLESEFGWSPQLLFFQCHLHQFFAGRRNRILWTMCTVLYLQAVVDCCCHKSSSRFLSIQSRYMYVYPADLHHSVQKTLNPATPYSGYKQATILYFRLFLPVQGLVQQVSLLEYHWWSAVLFWILYNLNDFNVQIQGLIPNGTWGKLEGRRGGEGYKDQVVGN